MNFPPSSVVSFQYFDSKYLIHCFPSHLIFSQLLCRWFRLEPWNQNARYLLVLNLLQTARQASYPQHLMSVLKRMTSAALTNQLFLNNTCERYRRFQLLLCSSELSLLGGDMSSCVSLARDAANLLLSDAYIFFAHLQLCRAHAAQDDHTSLTKEFTQCLKLKTDYPIGWISLKIIESCHRPQSGSTFSDSGFRESIKESTKSENSWLAVYSLFCGLISQRDQDFLRAEEFIAKACSLTATESCFFLCHEDIVYRNGLLSDDIILLCTMHQVKDGLYISESDVSDKKRMLELEG